MMCLKKHLTGRGVYKCNRVEFIYTQKKYLLEETTYHVLEMLHHYCLLCLDIDLLSQK